MQKRSLKILNRERVRKREEKREREREGGRERTKKGITFTRNKKFVSF